MALTVMMWTMRVWLGAIDMTVATQPYSSVSSWRKTLGKWCSSHLVVAVTRLAASTGVVATTTTAHCASGRSSGLDASSAHALSVALSSANVPSHRAERRCTICHVWSWSDFRMQ